MKKPDTSLLVSQIIDICQKHLFEEKWLIAPTRSIGYQWLDAATRTGAGLLNVHVKTMDATAMDLAAPELVRAGLRLVNSAWSELLVEQAFQQSASSSLTPYLHALEDSPGLIGALHRTVMDLRRAGLVSCDIDPAAFEVEAKGQELKTTLAAYENALDSKSLVDRADLFRLAITGIGGQPSSLPAGTLVLAPDRLISELGGLEGRLWGSLPVKNKIVLAEDRPGEGPVFDRNDAVQLFGAVGEVNEVREVMRRCVADGIPFDDVEIVCTDSDTFVPLFYETTARLEMESEIPVTFAAGVPVRYSRPARALNAWTSWVQEGFPQKILVRMIQDGLVQVELPADSHFSMTRLGKLLREVPIGFGAELYLCSLDQALEGLDEKTEWKRPTLVAIRSLIGQVLPDAETLQDPVAVLRKAAVFLQSIVPLKDPFDGYCRKRLVNEMDGQIAALEDLETDTNLDPWSWLSNLARTASAGNLGPRPGCLYVSSLHRAGHSGRGHTFILGLDDSRFPGAGLQDPLLLDGERQSLSPDLVTADQRLVRRLEEFSALLARLRGRVTLSYCARSLTDDRALFPSSVFVDVYRRISGNRHGDYESLLEWLPPPSAFAPSSSDLAVDGSEWWLAQTCGEKLLSNPEQVIDTHFPHLAHGRLAANARRSDRFTEYDGYVPEAGKECDPFPKKAKALSASRLEKLAASPLEYFFDNVLHISPPEDHCPDPTGWLDASTRGKLLHDVFREFMYRLRRKDLLPEFGRDEALLMEVLQQEADKERAVSPPPSEVVFNQEFEELAEIAQIFLREEERFCKDNIPLYFEVALGMERDREGTPLDTTKEVDISLPGGRSIRGRGRIDRIDEVAGSKGKLFRLWDYKTGGTWKYQQGDKVHWQGRVIQNIWYVELVRKRLKKLHPQATIESFGYFFPSFKAYGERIQWSADILSAGKEKIACLCEMLATGCFPESDDSGDLTYASCASAHGDVEAESEAIRKKLKNPANKALAPFARLRDVDWEGEND